MTDTTEPSDFSWEKFQARGRERERIAADLLPGNKQALFDVLAAAGVDSVTVHFDGCGDSGQIEEVEAKAGGSVVALPEGAIEIGRPLYDGSGADRQSLPVSQAIEELAYDFLEHTHYGWENNDGAYGEFIFDVGKRTITLDYNERYTETEYSEHSW